MFDTVIDHVTAGRHTGPGVPLGPVCALSRNGGECHVHGKTVDWLERTKPEKDASKEEVDAAANLRRGNCFSSTGIRSPLSAPGTEPLGVMVLCLRLLFMGFWVDAFAHDQDAGVGQSVRSLFPDATECLDRSHIQVCPDQLHTSFVAVNNVTFGCFEVVWSRYKGFFLCGVVCRGE